MFDGSKRRAIPHIAIALLLVAALSANSVSAAPLPRRRPTGTGHQTFAGPIDTGDKAAVNAAYMQEFLPTLDVPMGWTGSAVHPSSCVPGTISDEAQAATLTAVNYFRAMAGSDPVTFDPALQQGAQEAAMMMDAKNMISHSPDPAWPCYTSGGAAAAAGSNLAAAAGPDAIALYVADPGNDTVGHRRWLLKPTTSTMGHGATSGWDALRLFGTGVGQAGSTGPVYAPWPPAGFFPQPLQPNGLWSISTLSSGSAFNGATVTVEDAQGTELDVDVKPIANGYGPHTLVWQVTGLTAATASEDRTYTVTVGNIAPAGGGAPVSHVYTVTFFVPTEVQEPPPAEPTNRTVNATLALRRHLRGTVKLSSPSLSSCARNVDVMVQRLRSGRWVTVKRVAAPHALELRMRLRDRPGRYRAKTTTELLNGTDRCLSTTSKVARHRH